MQRLPFLWLLEWPYVKYPLALVLVLCGTAQAQICAPTAVVQPNSQVSAALSASSCVHSDGTSFSDYLINFPSRGAWSGSVTAADGVTPLTLILRDLSGAQLASGAAIQRQVERGSYHVLVNSAAPGQMAGYQLNSSFAVAPNILC